jgi:hypothetical protein
MFPTIGQAIAQSGDGDVIRVTGGTYTDDVCQIFRNVTLQAVGSRVVMNCTKNISNRKGIFIVGGTNAAPAVRIDGFDFVNAKVSNADGGNGAGIRFQNGSLSLTNCWFRGCQNGILATPIYKGTGAISIDRTEFGGCGSGTGQTHNCYVGYIDTLNFTNSYSHDCKVGHLLKTRANSNTIASSRLYDNTSNASYELDVPNGGNLSVTNCVIQQGANSQNGNIMTYAVGAAQFGLSPGRAATIANNTIVNDKTTSFPQMLLNQAPFAVNIQGNALWQVPLTKLCKGPYVASGNTVLDARPTLDTKHPFLTKFPKTTEEEDAAMEVAPEEEDFDVIEAFDVNEFSEIEEE